MDTASNFAEYITRQQPGTGVDVIRVALPKGHTLLIDAPDWPVLIGWSWRYTATGANQKSYVIGSRYSPITRGAQTVYLHRILAGNPKRPLVVDHINRNNLDNRRANLRVITQSENLANSARHADNTTGYKGVFVDKRRRGFYVRICNQYVGTYQTAEQAAQAYNRAALQRWGEFALLNEVRQ